MGEFHREKGRASEGERPQKEEKAFSVVLVPSRLKDRP